MSDPDRERAEFAQLENELRELVEEWRGDIVPDMTKEVQAKNTTLDRCAADIEELLADE